MKLNERYDKLGIGYSARRKPDPRIHRAISAALSGARSVLNVGAGTGSYESTHVPTLAVEPSFRMIEQRGNKDNVVQASAESLPFRDGVVDSVLAVLTLHHWNDIDRGLKECARTSRGAVTLLTWDPESPGFWLTQEYFPEILELDRKIFPSIEQLRQCLGPIEVKPVEIPADCTDGFLGAYWHRPEAYLSESVRSGMSSFARVGDLDGGLQQLRRDMVTGVWQRAHRKLQSLETCDLGYRLVRTKAH